MSSGSSNYKFKRRQTQRPEKEGVRTTLYDIIFEADTRAGRWFDIGLLVAILASITIVSLETVPAYQEKQRLMSIFWVTEWILTILFTLEYFLRLACVRHPIKYAFSFWGLIDLLSILPSYLTLLVGESTRSFVILRSVRLLRVFRVLKLWRMMNEADELSAAVWAARNKIVVFLAVVLVAVTISGTLMYHIETLMSGNQGVESDFTSIPQAMYWAIVTMTTVGYGDVVPLTSAGKVISAALILLGYSLIIVPSTFVSAEIMQRKRIPTSARCHQCDAGEQREDATYCYRCGIRLDGGSRDT
ncbi:MAG: ion transporter [Planctomycetota bacterium]|nr:ion transporter [Planctomycetota bacterium]